MTNPITQDAMRVGQDFLAAEKPAPAKPKRKERSNKKTLKEATAVTATTFVTIDPTAEANLAALTSPALVDAETEVETVQAPAFVPAVETDAAIVPHRTAPVGVSKWVYLGELRDYGWYGQKLRISPDSGLPEEGGTYQTQQIHGLYDEPHGRRVMGGFQLGDTVTVQKVRQEENGGVWAEVRKVRSVGKPGCVTCTQ
jgi:hypothetical protein